MARSCVSRAYRIYSTGVHVQSDEFVFILSTSSVQCEREREVIERLCTLNVSLQEQQTKPYSS